jgi:hypothetical protein
MRRTQLIGTKVTVELIQTFEGGRGTIARRVNGGSPGIIVIPTEIRIPASDLFPTMAEVVTCDLCGACSFRDFKGYAAHMAFKHEVTKTESKDDFMRRLRQEVGAVDTFRVIVTGTDEVSGKGGFASKEYAATEILLDATGAEDETFSVVSRLGNLETKSVASDDSLEASSTLSGKSSYVHVDFSRRRALS